MDLGPLEILVILAVVMMIFGVGKLPEIGGALGKGIREFRSASRADDSPPKIDETKSEPATPLATDAVCPGCGAAIAATLRFCTACGQPVKPASGS